MTKKDFFTLVIKLLGLFLILTTLMSLIPFTISVAMENYDLISGAWVLFSVALTLFLFVLLVFKAEALVVILKLDKDYENDFIQFGNLNSKEIIKIATIILGGLLIIDNAPEFLSHSFSAFRATAINENYFPMGQQLWLSSGIKAIIGFLLIKNYTFVFTLFQSNKG